MTIISISYLKKNDNSTTQLFLRMHHRRDSWGLTYSVTEAEDRPDARMRADREPKQTMVKHRTHQERMCGFPPCYQSNPTVLLGEEGSSWPPTHPLGDKPIFAAGSIEIRSDVSNNKSKRWNEHLNVHPLRIVHFSAESVCPSVACPSDSLK